MHTNPRDVLARTGDNPKGRVEVRDQATRARIVSLQFEEAANADCEDTRYGCHCIAYEMCCGCLLQ
jgi:hypothetical protein